MVGGFLTLLNDEGAPVLALSAEEYGGRIRTFNEDLSSSIDLYSNSESDARIAVNNRDGKTQISLIASESTGLISVMQNNGNPALVLSSDKNGGRMRLLNKNLIPTIEALNSEHHDGQFYLRQKDGHHQVALAQDKFGSGTLIVYNSDKKMSHYIGMHPVLRNGMMMIANKQGNPQSLITSDDSGGKVEHYTILGNLIK